MSRFRIGIGYDVHRLCDGRPLIVGGVTIPHPFGLLGHSDADVLIHAICDALLGAAGLGDIGQHFSDREPEWKGRDSRFFLRAVRDLLAKDQWQVGNIDATLIAERPKFASYLPAMKDNLSADLSIHSSCVNLKATTEEKMGFTGTGEGMAAHAVALIYREAKD